MMLRRYSSLLLHMYCSRCDHEWRFGGGVGGWAEEEEEEELSRERDFLQRLEEVYGDSEN